MEYVCGFVLLIVIAAVVTGAVVAVRARGTHGDFPYLLVLGTKVIGKKPGKMLRDRIKAAYAYLTQHPEVTCIVSGYQSGAGEISEAECMYRELTAMGIEESRIWQDPIASTTAENIQFCLALIEEKTGTKPERIGILSSEHHLLRAQLLASRQGIACTMVPARTSNARVLITNFLREIPLIWYYSIFYRRKQI